MRTIHKFSLARGAETRLKLPVGASVVRVDFQHDVPHVWVMLNTDAPYGTMHCFLIRATGAEIPDGFWPVGTMMEDGGRFVWHVVMKLELPEHV